MSEDAHSVALENGSEVRRSPDDLLAFCCGADIQRPSGSENGGRYCTRGAGVGTDHKRVGRCFNHEDKGPREGLPPWVGEIPDDQWKKITGGRDDPKKVTHGISELERVQKTFDEYVLDLLPDQDKGVYKSLAIEPVAIIDQAIKLNRIGVIRCLRFIRRRTQVLDLRKSGSGSGAAMDPEVRDAEMRMDKQQRTLARLMEVRVRYSELAEEQARDDFMAEFLSELPVEDWQKVQENPSYLDKFMQREKRL